MKQSIAIFKNDTTGKSENYPKYSVVVTELQADGTYKKMYIAKLWANKDAAPNQPLLKGEISTEYTKNDGTKVFGYKVIEDRPTVAPLPEQDTRDYSNEEEVQITW